MQSWRETIRLARETVRSLKGRINVAELSHDALLWPFRLGFLVSGTQDCTVSDVA